MATHISLFKNQTNQTVLSEKVKELTNMNIENSVKLELLENRRPYSQNSGRCELCTAEKFYILYSNLENKLNRKTEVISKCRHKVKYKLASNG